MKCISRKRSSRFLGATQLLEPVHTYNSAKSQNYVVGDIMLMICKDNIELLEQLRYFLERVSYFVSSM